MANKSVFEFKDYKAYLKYTEGRRPQNGRGFRAELSRSASCQTAYISQVLNGNANFSLEQAQAINKLLLHDKDEARFFILLVEYARAGTLDLRAHFLELMNELIQKQLNLKERFKIKEVLSLEDQTTYYSEWAYAAIHIAVTISKLSSSAAIAEFFQLPKLKVQKVLKFLVSSGLILESKPDQYSIGTARIHLGQDSALISKHHSNWRLQAMNSFERETAKDLHYTSVISLSNDDILEIKARLVKEIDAVKSTVKASKEETMCCFTLDFFSLDKRV
jgi:uncharacterized protein (TIGR02147 family)